MLYLQCFTIHSLLQYWVPRSLVVRAGMLHPSRKQIRLLMGFIDILFFFCQHKQI